MALKVSERAVLRLINTGLATSQVQLARTLGMRPTSINSMVRRLEESGLVYRDRIHRHGRGRPMVHFRIKSSGPVLVILWHDTRWMAGIFIQDTLQGTIQKAESAPIHNLDETFQALRQVRDLALQQAQLQPSDLAGAVLNLDAVRTAHRRALSSSVIPWIRNASAKQFSDALGCKVHLDVRTPWVIPELRARAAEGVQNLVVLNVGNGVSAHGAIVDQHWGAERFYRGELGHVVLDPRGPLCGCGHRGCVEAMIAGPALVQRVEADLQAGTQTALANIVGRTPNELFARLEELSEAGTDAYANTLVAEFIERVAWCVSNILNTIGPDVIVLSGYGLAGREKWRERILRQARSLTLYGETSDIRLEFSKLRQEDYLRELAKTQRHSSAALAS